MKDSRVVLCALWSQIVASPLLAQEAELVEPNRFLFEIGGGAASVSYGAEADALFDLSGLLGVDRVTVNLNLGIAWEVFADGFLGARIAGIGDRFTLASDFIQLNNYLYGASVLFYVFDGLRLHGSVGPASVAVLSDVGISEVSDPGWGVAAGISYDFSPNRTGSGVLVGAEVMAVMLGQDVISSSSVYVTYVRKRARGAQGEPEGTPP